jgi:hypothetical protein
MLANDSTTIAVEIAAWLAQEPESSAPFVKEISPRCYRELT